MDTRIIDIGKARKEILKARGERGRFNVVLPPMRGVGLDGKGNQSVRRVIHVLGVEKEQKRHTL